MNLKKQMSRQDTKDAKKIYAEFTQATRRALEFLAILASWRLEVRS
jgi:hypothetical protein